MQFAGTEPLTLANLCLPQFQVKDTSRVESFVHSQRLHSSSFAKESRAFDKPQQFKKHSKKRDEEPILPSARYQGVGFSSPILKARADQDTALAANVSASKALDGYSESSKSQSNRGRKRNASTRCSGKVSGKLPMSRGPFARKAAPSLNIEHIARLAERRDRKRAKRAIVNPVYASKATQNESPTEGDKDDKKRRQSVAKKKQAKISSELTLMQSFSATNISKERLTLKPGPSMGVFNKGKASISIPTNNKKRKARNDYTFSETKFLNPVKPLVPLSHHDSSSLSSCASNDSHATCEPIKTSKFFSKAPCVEHTTIRGKEARTGSEKKSLSITEDVHESSDIQADDSFEDSGRSEIWDIELDKSLPSDDRSLSNQGQDKPNALLKTHINKTENAPLPDTSANHEIQLPNRSCSVPRVSSPIRGQSSVLIPCSPRSLAPSHSASQVNAPSRYYFEVIKSAVHQRQTDEVKNQCLSVTHTSPSFRFRPIKSTDQVSKFPTGSFPFDPACEMKDDKNNTQMQLNVLMLNPDDTDDLHLNVPDHAEQDSQDLRMAANFDGHVPDDDAESCCWQDESNQELEPYELHQMYETTTDPIQQQESVTYEIYLGDRDGLDTFSNEECHSSLCAEEWPCIPVDDDGRDLRKDALTSHGVDNWTDLDHRAVSPSESPRYVQDVRGSDTTPPAFVQGRSLLFGIEEPIMHREGEVLWGIKSVEHEVATRLLKDHWLPQKL